MKTKRIWNKILLYIFTAIMFAFIFTFVDMGWNVMEVQATVYNYTELSVGQILNKGDSIKNNGESSWLVYDTNINGLSNNASIKVGSVFNITQNVHVKVSKMETKRLILDVTINHNWGPAATCTTDQKCTYTGCTAVNATAKGHTFNQYSASGDTITVKCARFSATDCGQSLTYTLKVNDCTGEIPYVNRNSYVDAEITKSGTGTPSVGEPSIKYRKVVDGTKQDLASKPSDTGSYEAYITMNGQTVSCSFSIAPGGDTYHFDANGGSGSMADQLMLQTDWDAGNKKLNKNTYTRTGYSFDKWTCESPSKEFSDEAEVDRPTLTPPVTYTLNAQWKANDYTVTFDNCGADIEAGSASATVTYDKTLDNITIPEKRCSEFNGYYTAVNGGGDKIYNADGSPAITSWTTTSDTTLYAHWTVNHNWGYEASGNHIIAKCKNDGCGFEQKLTLSASDSTYNKSAYTGASVSNEDEFPDKKTNSDIQYEGTTAAGASYAKRSTAPTDAGTYKAMVTVDGKTATKDFTINKSTQSASVSVANYEWGSTLPGPSVSGIEESATPTYYYNTVNSTSGGKLWSGLTSETLDVGDYYIYATLAETDNYKSGTTSISTFHVSGLTFDPSCITSSSYSDEYDGESHTIGFSISDSSVEVKFSTASDTGYSDTIPTFKNVGDYEVFYRVKKFGYEVFQESKTVTITKAPITISGIKANNKVYDSTTDATLNYSAVTYGGIITGDTLTVTATGTFDDANVGTGKDINITGLTLGGSSEGNYELAGSGQQNKAQADITQRVATLEWTNLKFDYDGEEHKPTATVANLAGSDSCVVTVEVVGGSGAIDVGTYTAKADSLSNGNYKLPTNVTQTFEIDKIDQSGTVVMSNYTYNGTVPTPNISGCNDDPEITYYYSLENKKTGGTKWEGITPTSLEPETYYMYAVLKETTHYKGLTTEPVEFKVTGEDMGSVTAGNNEVTYTGVKEHGITVNAPVGATISYGTTEGSYTLSECPTYKDVNTYTIYYRVTMTGKNPVKGSADVIINKAELTVTPNDNQTKIYGDADPAFTYTVSGLLGSDTASVVSGTLKRESGEDVTAAGYELADNNLTASNYNITCTSGVKFMITPRDITEDMITLATKKFGVTGGDIDVADNNNITVMYKGAVLAEHTDYEISNNVASAIGTYNVTITGKGNFKGSANKEWKITKQIVDGISADNVTVTYDGLEHTIVVNGTQSGDVITYGTSETSTDKSSLKYKGAGSYTIYYKVYRNEDYEPYEGSATLTINPKVVGVTWGSNTSFVYNGYPQVPTATASGLIGSDTCFVYVSGAKDAGTHTATATGVSNSNYTLPASAPTTPFTITRKSITVAGRNASKYVNEADPSLTYDAPGLCAGDTLSGITVVRDAGESVGSYLIRVTVTGDANPNYAVTTVDGTFIIKKREFKPEEPKKEPEKEDEPREENKPSNSFIPVVQAPITGPKIQIPETIIPVELKAKNPLDDKVKEIIPISKEDNDPNAGKLTLHVEILENSPIKKAEVGTPVEELLHESNIFTKEEKAAILNGENAKVWVSVDKMDMSKISKAEEAKLTSVARSIEGDGVKLLYFDVNLFKQIGSSDIFAIREPGTFIEVSIELPDYAINNDKNVEREYKVLRLHDGDVMVLDATFDNLTHMLTFETDRFSTYVFAYADKPVEKVIAANDITKNVVEQVKEVEESNETSGHNYLWLIIMLIVIVAIVVFIIYRKKKEDEQYIIK